ncbi:MAG: hydrogenase maturation protease [Leptolyngbyaceae cyanobacterium bins.59]|nr:hydrogenase maturation protease [Leptolyngbyaceae cyanobacterium bins.59]
MNTVSLLNLGSVSVIPYLVIGYGNSLRSDDGAGCQVAETVAGWGLEQVESLSLHQLTPDLAEIISRSNIVIFVDAAVRVTEATIEELHPSNGETFTNHYADPRSLLALARVLYQRVPAAYRVLIPATSFEFGETFSSLTQESVSHALAKIKQLICISHPVG